MILLWNWKKLSLDPNALHKRNLLKLDVGAVNGQNTQVFHFPADHSNISKYTPHMCRYKHMASWFLQQMSCVFFGCVGPIHHKTCLREAYASLRGVKGSLRGGVLFGVAYAGGYARIMLSAYLKKSALMQLWLLSRYLAFCGFISFHFGLLWLHCAFHKSVWFVLLRDQWLLPSYLQKGGGPMAGAISRLRGAYAEVTQRLRGGSW